MLQPISNLGESIPVSAQALLTYKIAKARITEVHSATALRTRKSLYPPKLLMDMDIEKYNAMYVY